MSLAPLEHKPAGLHLVEMRQNKEAWERKPLRLRDGRGETEDLK